MTGDSNDWPRTYAVGRRNPFPVMTNRLRKNCLGTGLYRLVDCLKTMDGTGLHLLTWINSPDHPIERFRSHLSCRLREEKTGYFLEI